MGKAGLVEGQKPSKEEEYSGKFPTSTWSQGELWNKNYTPWSLWRLTANELSFHMSITISKACLLIYKIRIKSPLPAYLNFTR